MERRGGHRQQEIKNGRVVGNALLRRMVRINRQTVADVRRQVLLTASEKSFLRRLHGLDAAVPVGLIGRATAGRPRVGSLPVWLDVILIDIAAADEDYVRRAHRAGFLVSVRGVNTVRRLHRAVALGVDRVVTDRPELLGHSC